MSPNMSPSAMVPSMPPSPMDPSMPPSPMDPSMPPSPMDPSMPPSGGMGMDAMHSALYWGKDVTIVFSSWNTDNMRGYVFSLIAVFAVAALYQVLGKFRQSLVARWNDAKVSAEPSLEAGGKVDHGRTYRIGAKILLALLFAINVAIGYLIMLCIMSFNVGVFLAVVLGMTTGYLFTD